MDELWFCYMLECSDGSFYVGIANDLKERLQEHGWGKDSEYTAKRRPVKLVWHQGFASKQDARRREVEIKGWSRRKKLELIRKKQRDRPGRPPACPEGTSAASGRRIDKTEWRQN